MICSGEKMRIIAFIDQWKTIVHILTHLNLWPPEPRTRPSPADAVTDTQNILNAPLTQLDTDFFSA